MQEQPPSDPPRRDPAASARRSRSTKPTFTPPPAPTPPADQAGADGDPAPQPRRAKAAPIVLFQPPDPTLTGPPAGDPGRTPGGPAPTAAPRPRPSVDGTSDEIPAPGDADPATRKATRARRPAEPVEEVPGTGTATARPTKRTAARKATPPAKKAAPAARNRTGQAGAAAGDAGHVTSAAPRPKIIDSGTAAADTTPATADASRSEPASVSRAIQAEAATGTDTTPAQTTTETDTAPGPATVEAATGRTERAADTGPGGPEPVDRADAAPPALGIGSGTVRAGGADAAPPAGEPTGPVSTAGATAATPETAPPATTRSRRTAVTKAAAKKKAAPTKASAPAKRATRAKKAAPPTVREQDVPAEAGGRPAPRRPEPEVGSEQGAGPVTSLPGQAAAPDEQAGDVATEQQHVAPAEHGVAEVAEKLKHTDLDDTTAAAAPEAEPTPTHQGIGGAVPEPGRAVADLDRPGAVSREPESGRTSGAGWRAVAARVLAHPGFAPELLALAAVEELGPQARDWAERTREAYPDAAADGLARLATRRFVRLAGTGGALAAGTGLLAPVTELAAVLWTQANLVLHLAAVYGRDPGHPDRVAELLMLTQVHPDVGTARAALDAVRSAGAPVGGPWPRAAEAAWRLATPLAAQAGGWLGLRLAARLLPGAAVLTAAAGDAAAAERLAARATGLYRPVRAR